jgi:thioredoxin
MRKINSFLFIAAILAISVTACSNTNGGNDKNSVPGQDGKTTVASTPGNEGTNAPEFLTKASFKEKIWDFDKNPQEWVYEGSEPAIIDFYADWCKPCKMVSPILEEISNDYKGKIKVYKINTDKERDLAALFQISSIPAFLYIPANGKPTMDRGYKDKAAFEQIIKEFLLK